MFHFTVADVKCVTDVGGSSLQIEGTPNVSQINQILDVVRRIQDLKLERRAEIVEITDVDDLPPGLPDGLKELIGRLLGSRFQAVLFEEVPLYHFFETESGEKFCKTQPSRAVVVLGPEENGTEVTFNRTRIVNYLGSDRATLYPPDEKPSIASFHALTDGSWFTDDEHVYCKVHETTVQKYKLNGEPISLEGYRGPKDNLKSLGLNPIDAWKRVEGLCRASN